MAATTTVTGSLPSDIATSLTGPTEGTTVQAGDVRIGEATLISNDKMIRDGNPTVHGNWAFSGDAAGASTATPTLTVTGASDGTTGAPAILAHGGAGASGSFAVRAFAGAGSNQEGGGFTGDGSGTGVTGQGGTTGHGGTFTAGAGGNGHGAIGTATNSGGSGVKAVAAGGVAAWAAGGPVLLDTNPAATGAVVTGDPGAHQLWKGNVPVAWGFVGTTGSGGFTAGTNGQLGGFGIASATMQALSGGGHGVRITLRHAMADTAYSVSAMMVHGDPAGLGSWIVNETDLAGGRTTTTFDLYFATIGSGPTYTPQDPTNQSLGFSVQVFGNQ